MLVQLVCSFCNIAYKAVVYIDQVFIYLFIYFIEYHTQWYTNND